MVMIGFGNAVRREMPHEWQKMPGYYGESFCCRCGVVRALCGTNGCTAEERRQYSRDVAMVNLHPPKKRK